MSNQVNLTINDKSVSVDPGSTIMVAAQKAGVSVPHFCWHPGLSIAGVCRFCMVKIEGQPRLQIACNTAVTEGMKVSTVGDDVKEAHKWALEFHLINHPLDCPICDQAGECELQNYYMKVGRYDSQMGEQKVLKPKALDVGRNLVLDTERCILCSRCVRFEEEVTKTGALGIFNRGDRSVIGTVGNKKIDHNYSYNLVDICPVGAFTAKDFRFKQRVWFLQETKTICPGCSTGCSVTLFYNKNSRTYYRLKPRFNEKVNGYWMCDYGRTMYDPVNAENRSAVPYLQEKSTTWSLAMRHLARNLNEIKQAGTAARVAIIVTPQYTNEEYAAVFGAFKELLGQIPTVFVWRDAAENVESFDGLLLRGDLNSNTAGLNQALAAQGIQPSVIGKEFTSLATYAPTHSFVFGPEIEKSYTQLVQDLQKFTELPRVAYFGTARDSVSSKFELRLPTKVYAEKNGTVINYKGDVQNFKATPPVFATVRAVDEIFLELVQKFDSFLKE